MAKRALILGSVWPESRSSAAGIRTLDLLAALGAMGAEVSVASHAKKSEFTDELGSLGVRELPTELNRESFERAVREYAPDYVIFDRFMTEEQYGARVEAAAPGAIRILDTIDLHSLRRARAVALKAGKNSDEVLRAGQNMGASEDFLREASAIHRSDLALVLSDIETALLEETYGFPRPLLHYYPFSYAAPSASPAFADRAHFVFLGNFRHEPNHDSIFFTVKEIWPRIRARLKHAELHVYGAYPPREVSELHAPSSGIFLHGRAEEAIPTFAKYRVNLAALRFGAGIKGKVADGWAAGTPAVGTRIAAEGMRAGFGQHAGSDWGGIIADSPDEIAMHAVALHEDPRSWKTAQAAGQKILAEKFCPEKNHAAFRAAIESLELELAERRKANIVGAMLRMNQHRATEYFSRWIELKEKNIAKEENK